MREQGAPTSAAWDHVAVLFPKHFGLRKLQKDNVLVSRELAAPTERLVSVSSQRLLRFVQLYLRVLRLRC